jgi:di/tricarboxylate transporter
MTDADPNDADTRTWFERNGIIAALVLFGAPFLIAVGLRELGASDTVAELTQIIVGVLALVAVAVFILRNRKRVE